MEFARYHGLDVDMTPIFSIVIRAMDAVYLKYMGKKKPKDG